MLLQGNHKKKNIDNKASFTYRKKNCNLKNNRLMKVESNKLNDVIFRLCHQQLKISYLKPEKKQNQKNKIKMRCTYSDF